MSKYIFYIETPSKLIGKQEFFIDMAAYIADKSENEVYYVNHFYREDYEKYKNTRLHYISVDKINLSEFDGAIFITPLEFFFPLFTKIKNHYKSKICLYMYDERSVNWMTDFFDKELAYEKLKELFNQTNACSFADEECYKKLCGLKETYFPQVTNFDRFDLKSVPIINNEEINIGYLGSLTNKRAGCIKTILDDIMNSGIRKKINFHIIGDSSLFYKLDITSAHESHCRFICTGRLSDEHSCEYLRKNVDLVFANDENAVKAALFAVPVAIPVIKNYQYAKNTYILFSDIKGYILNWTTEKIINSGNETRTLIYLLNGIYNGDKESIGNKCKEFGEKKFTCKSLMLEFLDYVNNSSLTTKKCIELPVISNALKNYTDFVKKYHIEKFDSYLYFKEKGEFLKEKPEKNILKSIDKVKSNIIKTVNNREKRAEYLKVQRGYKEKASRIAEKYKERGKINVAFVVLFDSVFPTRPVFEKMLKDDMFNPYIIVIPNVYNSYKYQINLYKKGLDSLSAQYPGKVIGAYDISKDEYKKFGDTYSIMFFCNPYKHLVHPYHHVEYFLDKDVLPVYSSYGFAALKFWEEVVKLDFYNQVWKVCVENQANFEHLKKIQKIKGINGIITGYLKMDGLALKTPNPKTRKNIIICPHHTVQNWDKLNISNFIRYSELFIKLPQMFPEIDFIFRPHPLLVSNLLNHKIWSKKQIENYFKRLLSSPNIKYDTSGDYMQEFADTDAMIHDCGSFIGEYLYTMKPCMYMMKDREETYRSLLPFGKECMDNYYHAYCENDIIEFIKNVIINGNDPMKEKREKFVQNKIMVNYPHAAEETINIIKKALKI